MESRETFFWLMAVILSHLTLAAWLPPSSPPCSWELLGRNTISESCTRAFEGEENNWWRNRHKGRQGCRLKTAPEQPSRHLWLTMRDAHQPPTEWLPMPNGFYLSGCQCQNCSIWLECCQSTLRLKPARCKPT